MDVQLTIGEFSKMTYLSVKALRHYHDVGLLEPVAVDPVTGYRRYAASQVGTAQAIRRFRDVDMPIDEVRQVLHATDDAERQHVIVEHLDRLRRQLEQTQVSVASLQSLLADPRPVRADVELRAVPARTVLSRRRVIPFDDEEGWLAGALARLRADAVRAGVEIDGPDGALFSDELFEVGEGEVVAFVPVAPGTPDAHELPATNLAVLVHEGPPSELDQAYGALGAIVAERRIGGPGPVREHYLTATTTEVCWPVTIGTIR
ncbi:MAG: MerR family transcriptional regulator [Ilumatobacteraceae bacterium]